MKEYDPHPISRYIFFAGLIAIVVFLGLQFGGPYLADTWEQDIDGRTRIVTAFISVSGTLFSAIVGVLLFNLQQNEREKERTAVENAARARASKEERTRLGRFAAGLRAEITESITRMTDQFTDEAILEALKIDAKNFDNAIKHNKNSKNNCYRAMPAGVGLERNIVFEQHQDDIRDLPETVVWSLVSYYQNDLYLVRYLNSMTEGMFDGLEPNRQRKAAVYFRNLGQETLIAGLRAKAVLDAFLIQHESEDRNAKERKAICELSSEIMKRRPSDRELARVLSSRETRSELGRLLRELTKPKNNDQMDAFLEAVGVKSKSS